MWGYNPLRSSWRVNPEKSAEERVVDPVDELSVGNHIGSSWETRISQVYYTET